MIGAKEAWQMAELIRTVTTVGELTEAAADSSLKMVFVSGRIENVRSFRLAPGLLLSSDVEQGGEIVFAPGEDGVQLSKDNGLAGIQLSASPDRRAIYNDTHIDGLGTMHLSQVTTTGLVQILARDRVRSGHVDIDGLDVTAADARPYGERPHGFGVDVLQGAFTLWNMQPDRNIALTADLRRISTGRSGAPVRGSGVFVSGAGTDGGVLNITHLETGPIYVDGGIPQGTSDLISGGVFVLSGANVDEVHNRGMVVTYGPNDMALDNWGEVDRWIGEAPVTSYGPSGIGFVNFGNIGQLRLDAPCETYGAGARAFDVYTGSIGSAEFESLVTHGAGSIGAQISRPIGELIVHQDITTQGGAGESLVEGVLQHLVADALSVKQGGDIGSVRIGRSLATEGDGVATLEVQGEIRSLDVAGGITAKGRGSDAVHVEGGVVPLEHLRITADAGVAVLLDHALVPDLQGVAAHGSTGDVVVAGDSRVGALAGSPADLGHCCGNEFAIGGPGRLEPVR
jgi:hypothetical protein